MTANILLSADAGREHIAVMTTGLVEVTSIRRARVKLSVLYGLFSNEHQDLLPPPRGAVNKGHHHP